MLKSIVMSGSLLALMATSSLSAQERTREILYWKSSPQVVIIASSTGKIQLASMASVDRVILQVDPDDVKQWADSAEKLLGATLNAPPTDKLAFKSKHLWGSNDGDVTFNREVQGTDSKLFLYFTDQYVVNTVFVPLTPERAAEFIDALRKAALAVKEISH